VLLWFIGVAAFCKAVVGNMGGTVVGGIGYAWFGMSGIIVGIAGIAGMTGIVGIGKKPLNGGLELNDSGCVR
jgi:hypothetical protein